MALSLGSNTYNRVAREDAEFPILCQVCLGDNPYLRMMKDRNGAECKICLRPFTTFRWCPGRGMRYKKTEICQTCCKIKNVCQTCLLDMEFGLPVQVRDAAIQHKDVVPKSGVNRDFFIQNAEAEFAKTDATGPSGALADVPRSSEMLAKLSRSTPYYRRNLPHICSFWVKGECKRGEECPYRHEKPTDPDDPLSEQNIKDRYYGVNDPVAAKLLNRAETMPALVAPADSAITTLYIGNLGLDGEIVEKDLQDYFYQFGEIRAINILASKGCAFVQFTTRSSAEMASEKAFNKLIVKGRRLTVRWGKPQSLAPVAGVGLDGGSSYGGRQLQPVPGLPALPLPPLDYFGLSQPGLSTIGVPKGLPEVNLNPPVPEPYEPLINEGNEDEQEGGSEVKRPKMDSSSRSTLPGMPQGYPLWGTKPTAAPNVRFTQAGPSMGAAPPPPPTIPPPGRPIYYPSQDPLRLGAKKLQE